MRNLALIESETTASAAFRSPSRHARSLAALGRPSRTAGVLGANRIAAITGHRSGPGFDGPVKSGRNDHNRAQATAPSTPDRYTHVRVMTDPIPLRRTKVSPAAPLCGKRLGLMANRGGVIAPINEQLVWMS